MSGRLLSDSWYRVAALKPALRAHARLHRHRYRGQVWYVLQDQAAARAHRFTAAARLVLAAMNGERTVQELWDLAERRLGEAAPTQDELIALLGQLHAADLLRCDVTPDVAELFERGERQQQARRRRAYRNPMAARFGLWDPQRFLTAMQPALAVIWSRWGALVWLAVVGPALVLVLPHVPELTENFSDRVLGVDNLLLLWLVFPAIKALHELGHAMAVKVGGGEVHDMGVMLLVLMPVPYVDASAASAFRSKWQRALVGAAGMIVELFVASLAFYVWLLVEPGAVRAIAFNVMLVAGVSTLVFNGNPLLRYDAYFILADLIEIPNLALRSRRYWGYLIKRYAFGAGEAETFEATPAERAWFAAYGLASTAYRTVVSVAIVLFIAGQFFVIGVLLALWAVCAMAVVPLVQGFRHLASAPALAGRRLRVWGVVAGAAASLAWLVFALPMPFHSQTEGVIWLPEEATLRAGASGFFRGFLTPPGTSVAEGAIVARSEDPLLAAQIRIREAKVAELQAVYAALFVRDRVEAEITREQLASEKAALERARERAAGLLVASRSDGVLTAALAGDMSGRYYRKGDLLGHVLGAQPALVRVVAPQAIVDSVRSATRGVDVRLASDGSRTLRGHIVREVPAAEQELPSSALAVGGGGEIPTDPRHDRKVQALERLFQFDIAVDDQSFARYYGSRAYVRFEHPPEPLARQWYRRLRKLFLTRFNA